MWWLQILPKIDNQWSRFGEDIDDVVPQSVLEAHTGLSLEDSNPDEVADPCNWSRSFTNEELRKAQENDHYLNYLLLRKTETETSPSDIELSISSPAVKHWWKSNEYYTISRLKLLLKNFCCLFRMP